ncbi:MAG: hypothetical protein ACJ8IR_07290 [Alphaproteobacteria bacterium]|jgi:hypothetical protein
MNSDTTVNVGPYLAPLLVVALVALRLIRNKPQKVKPGRLFVTPLLLVLAIYLTLRQAPAPGALWLLVDAAAALAGAGVGWLTARHRAFTLDAETGEIMSRATPIGTLVFGAVFAVRFGLKMAFPQLNAAHAYAPASADFHPAASAIGWADAGLVFSAAMVTARAATIWLCTRHLVEQQRAQKEQMEQPEPSV